MRTARDARGATVWLEGACVPCNPWVMTDYLPAVTTLLGAAIALVGVAFTARAADQRDRRNRLWDRRAEAFTDALTFLYGLRRSAPVGRGDPGFEDWSRSMDDLMARLSLFSDDETAQAFADATRPTHGKPPHSSYPESAWSYASLLTFEEHVRRYLGTATDRSG